MDAEGGDEILAEFEPGPVEGVAVRGCEPRRVLDSVLERAQKALQAATTPVLMSVKSSWTAITAFRASAPGAGADTGEDGGHPAISTT
ncbi:hypothetical protein AR689_16270 [Arthrobacter sp. EpRS71]|nr:hypothetical protein AR689_16270 [Arthrobacter sp. EpRS71]